MAWVGPTARAGWSRLNDEGGGPWPLCWRFRRAQEEEERADRVFWQRQGTRSMMPPPVAVFGRRGGGGAAAGGGAPARCKTKHGGRSRLRSLSQPSSQPGRQACSAVPSPSLALALAVEGWEGERCVPSSWLQATGHPWLSEAGDAPPTKTGRWMDWTDCAVLDWIVCGSFIVTASASSLRCC